MKILLDDNQIQRAITRITHEILEHNKGVEDLVLVGIETRGIYLMERIAHNIQKFEDKKIETFALNIDYWRDDDYKSQDNPNYEYNFTKKKVVLVDDVLFRGRTVRAAMDAVIEYGRPSEIQLAVLVDRGHRELPIRADYVGKNIPTSTSESVKVKLEEIDGLDSVILEKL